MTRTMLMLLGVWMLGAIAIATFAAGPATQPAAPTTQPGGRLVALPLDEVFARLDVNHDGKITRAEATGEYAQRFALWDTAGRGYVTRDEVHAYRIAHGIGDDGRRLRPTTRASSAPPTLLLGPADWRLEQSPMPPSFAPTIDLTGTDETRFAPGMYNTSAPDYFTYAKAMAIDGSLHWDSPDVRSFLDKYYQGLSASRLRRSPNAATQPAAAGKSTAAGTKPMANGESGFVATVPFVDAFTDGRRITLHVELRLLFRPTLHRTYVIMLVSPSPTGSTTWTHLREVGQQAAEHVPAPTTQP